MINKLKSIEMQYEKLNEQISDSEIIADQNRWKKLVKEHSQLEPIVNEYREYKKIVSEIKESKDIIEDGSDTELSEIAELELIELVEKEEIISENLKVLLIPKDPNDEKNVIVEIRGGAGGDEAALFAGDLVRMYMRYAERNRWKTEIMSSNTLGTGGIKEMIFLIEGQGAYSRLKYESGVHRVQRIPATESGGRIHTSTATVAVLPEAEDVEIEVHQNDLRIDVYRSSGNGGQSVNTTDSAVRITHEPTGIVVTCQDEKSQLKNKDKAMKILKTRLYDIEVQKHQDAIAADRKSQVGTGDRSERIRTYNFPQGRITDHRIGLTVYKLEDFLDGGLDEMIDALITEDQASKLSSSEV
jgi:peptide chain release factor 1